MSEQEIAFRLTQLEKEVDRYRATCEKGQSEIEKLRDRVQSLETVRTVVVSVAVIFGLAGAWGSRVLHSVQHDIEPLQSQVAELQKGSQPIFDAARKAAAQANDIIDQHAREQVAQVHSQINAFVGDAKSQIDAQAQQDSVLDLAKQVRRLNKWNDSMLTKAGHFATGYATGLGDAWVKQVGGEWNTHKSDPMD
jgi:hypothetical protein